MAGATWAKSLARRAAISPRVVPHLVHPGCARLCCRCGGEHANACAMGTTTIVTSATMCIPLFLVTPNAGMNGSISPSMPVAVAQGQPIVYGDPDCRLLGRGFRHCGGTRSRATYTTSPSPDIGDVQAIFAPLVVVPDAHQISVAHRNNMQVALTAIPPMFDGGALITSFVFTCGGVSVTSSTIRGTVTGLTNFVPVDCSVVAVEQRGSSLPSVKVTVVPLPRWNC